MKRGVFISYRRTDSAGAAGRIRDRLTGELGSDRVFMDVTDIAPGVDFEDTIKQRLANASAVIAIIGPSWNTDPRSTGELETLGKPDYVRFEIGAALKAGVQVIPVLIDDAKMPSAADLPSSLKKLTKINALEIRHSKFDSDVSDLVALLKDAKPQRSWLVPVGVGAGLAAAVGVIMLQTVFRGGTPIPPASALRWEVTVPSSGNTDSAVIVDMIPRDSAGSIAGFDGELKLEIAGANPQFLTANLVGDGTYRARYEPRQPGLDTLIVTATGDPLPGSPFLISVDRPGNSGRPPRPRTASVEFATRAPATYYVLQAGNVVQSGEVTNRTWVRRLPAGQILILRLIWRVAGCNPADTIWEERVTLEPDEERQIPTKFQCA